LVIDIELGGDYLRPRRDNLKILYEGTYISRGATGIPRDALQTANVLLRIKSITVDLIFSPRGVISKFKFSDIDSLAAKTWISKAIGLTLRKETSEFTKELTLFDKLTIIFQSLSLFRKVKKVKLNEIQIKPFHRLIKLSTFSKKGYISQIYVFGISYFNRFSRPKILGLYKIDTRDYDYFIQQQVDPISISKRTKHIIRLHDFLPFTYPHFFTKKGVKFFTESMTKMLRSKDKIWILDTEASVREFKAYFGNQYQVRSIPCVVEFENKYRLDLTAKENQICMVNTIEPRKRVGLAIDSFRSGKIVGVIPSDWTFVIIGKNGWGESDKFFDDLARSKFGTDIIYLAEATDFQVSQYLSKSRIILSTSEAEGFGIPPLEGILHGCLPVVSAIPQHIETTNNLAIYFEGNDVGKVVDALQEAIRMPKEICDQKILDLQAHVLKNYSSQAIEQRWKELFEEFRN
jgi:glycosyltransferase involved in cell wall biosynthesis